MKQETNKSIGLGRRLFLSALIIGVVGAVAGYGSFSAFSATTVNSGNSIASGTVAIGDNDSDSALYSATNQVPGAVATKCIKVTYTGTLNADVRLYTADTLGGLAPFINLTITPGTSSDTFPGCSGFVADSGGAIYSGTLKNFADTRNSWSNGLVDNPGTVATKWSTDDSVVYRFQLTLQDSNSAKGLTTNAHSFTWEARNQ